MWMTLAGVSSNGSATGKNMRRVVVFGVYDNHRLAVCRKCRFVADRDVIGAMNISPCFKEDAGEPRVSPKRSRNKR